MPAYLRNEPRVGDGVAGVQDPAVERRLTAGRRVFVVRVSTAGPGVQRAPNLAGSHEWGTWNPVMVRGRQPAAWR